MGVSFSSAGDAATGYPDPEWPAGVVRSEGIRMAETGSRSGFRLVVYHSVCKYS
jgi:hypothetical protein